MRVIRDGFGMVRALCLALAIALAAAPATTGTHHGPGALDNRADVYPQSPDDHDRVLVSHDAGEHDQLSLAVLPDDRAAPHPGPDRQILAEPDVPGNAIPDGPRRPPRLPLI